MLCLTTYERRPVLNGCVLAVVFFIQISNIFGQASTPKEVSSGRSPENVAKSELTYNVISADGGGYGYDIYSNGRMLIHQPSVPGMPGATGFKTKKDANSVAELVIKKLKNREIPPAVSKDELRDLRVID